MKINKLSPNFEVSSIVETVKFYEDNLGFALVMAVPETQDGIHQSIHHGEEYVYAMMKKDNVEFMFQRSDSFKEDVVLSKGLNIGASISFYMEVEGLDEFYKDLKSKKVSTTDLKTTWYGMNEFYVKDLNGYILAFAEKVE